MPVPPEELLAAPDDELVPLPLELDALGDPDPDELLDDELEEADDELEELAVAELLVLVAAVLLDVEALEVAVDAEAAVLAVPVVDAVELLLAA